MNDDVRAEFRTGGLLSAHLASIALVAAEAATVEGRLNLAKVLRATALAGRTSGLRLERIASADATSLDLFEEIRTFYDEISRRLTDLAEDPSLSAAERASIVSLVNSGASLRDIQARTAESITSDRDVPESVVAQILFGCEECGYIAEGSRPDLCPACGSIAGEWQLFTPFYSSTPEHISRLKPDQIVTMLQGDPARLCDALAGHDDEALRRSPAPGEWCAKEISGHMIDIAELHNRRLLALLDPDANVAPETTLLPWKILDGQDYPNATADALTSRFEAAINEALTLLACLQSGDWCKKADLVSGRVPVIDMASWLANHNLAHMAQLHARLAEA